MEDGGHCLSLPVIACHCLSLPVIYCHLLSVPVIADSIRNPVQSGCHWIPDRVRDDSGKRQRFLSPLESAADKSNKKSGNVGSGLFEMCSRQGFRAAPCLMLKNHC